MVFDYGTIILIITAALLTIFAIMFLLLKKNNIAGIKIPEAYSSEENWHRIHMIASFFRFHLLFYL